MIFYLNNIVIEVFKYVIFMFIVVDNCYSKDIYIYVFVYLNDD